jgi:membrane protease YdiL (CAAX protease family)
MQIPGVPSQFFLIYLLILLPWMGFRNHQKLRRQTGGLVSFSDSELERIWFGTIVHLSFMFALAFVVGRGFGFQLFAFSEFSARVMLAGLAALSVCLAIRVIVRRLQNVESRRHMVVFALAPRTARQWILTSISILAASVAEESAYRGVGWAILTWSTASSFLSALACCAAFAMAHWMQGWKSMMLIFIFAAIMHSLTAYTKSLVPAMLVHAVYDFVVVWLIAVEASTQRNSAAAMTSLGSGDR